MVKNQTRIDKWYRTKKFVSQLSAATLGYIHRNAPGAIVGYVKGGELYDKYLDPGFEQEQPGSLSLPNNKMLFGGHFQGSVNPLGKEGELMKRRCLSQGWHNSNEAFGLVADPDAVYIQHSTYHDTLFIEAMMGAMFRKLFKKASQNVDEAREFLIGNTVNNSDGIRLQFFVYDPIEAITSAYEYNLPTDTSMQSLISDWTAVRTYFAQYMIDGNDFEPFKLVLLYRDGTSNPVTPEYRHGATLNLRNEHITLYCSGTMTFQNRTKGALAGASNNEIESVDAQPLVYRTFNFKHADARQKAPNGKYFSEQPFGLEGAPQVGVRTFRAAQLNNGGIGVSWRNRPDKNIFSNCIGSYDKAIEPGAMHNSAISYEFSGNFPTVIKKIKTEYTAEGVAVGLYGRSQLFCFEEIMRTASTNLVTVAYEKHTEVGVILKTNPPVPILSMFSIELEQINTP